MEDTQLVQGTQPQMAALGLNPNSSTHLPLSEDIPTEVPTWPLSAQTRRDGCSLGTPLRLHLGPFTRIPWRSLAAYASGPLQVRLLKGPVGSKFRVTQPCPVPAPDCLEGGDATMRYEYLLQRNT